MKDTIFSTERINVKSSNGNSILINTGHVTEKRVCGRILSRYHDDNGLIETWNENTLTIYGGMFLAEKASNTRMNFDTNTLDRTMQVFSDAYELNNENLGKEKIIGLMCGNAPTESLNVIMPGKRQSKVVPGVIPYRVRHIDNDLEGEERDRYFMRVVEGDKIKYYGKKASLEVSEIRYENGTLVPNTIHTTNGFINDIDVYNKLIFNINTLDFREHFINMDGNTTNCAINTIGLLTGIPVLVGAHTEYRNVRCITTASVTRHSLSGVSNTVEFEYYLLYR